MNIAFQSTDFHSNDNTAILWYDVDGDQFGVSFTGWTCDQSHTDNCTVSVVDVDGCPINDNDSQYVGLSSAIKESAVERLPEELTSAQISCINASAIGNA